MSGQDSNEDKEWCASQPLRKVPREARPDSCATEALCQFLRDISPPAEASSSDEKRLSGVSSRHLRGKAFLKSLLRSNSSQRVLLNAHNQASVGSAFPHNCVILRQVVPGQNQQYYRIVRDSSQFDSLETQSTFRVNYQFQRHDVSKTHSTKDSLGKENVQRKFKQDRSPQLQSTSRRLKPYFRTRVRKGDGSSPKQQSPTQAKITHSHTDGEHRGRSLRRSSSAIDREGLNSSHHQAIQPRVVAHNADLQIQTLTPRVNREEFAPQLGDFTAGTAFPASDLIKSWSRQRSIKSVRSSPGKIQSIRPRKTHSPQASISPRKIRNARSALPIAVLRSPVSKDIRPTPVSHSSTKHSKKLASPVKLGVQRPLRQTMLDRPRPLMKDLTPLALISNPSRALEHASKAGSLGTGSPTSSCTKTAAIVNIAKYKGAGQRNSVKGLSLDCGRYENAVGTSSPTKKTATISVDLGCPTTPPPRTPLPPVPRNSRTKFSSFDGSSYRASTSDGHEDFVRYTHHYIPPKSPARISQILDLKKQQEALRIVGSKQVHVDDSQHRGAERQENLITQHDNHLKTPEVSSLKWPQPPKANLDSDEQQSNTRHSVVYQTQKDDTFRNRIERINSLKRRHIQHAHEQTQNIRGTREVFTTSKAPLTTVLELPAQPNGDLESSFTTLVSPQDESPFIATTSDCLHTKRVPNLTFSGVKTNATVKPLSTTDENNHHRTLRRTVYRSHSTQMTPGKRTERFDSESSASNDENTAVHHDQQGLSGISNYEGDSLNNVAALAITKDQNPVSMQTNGHSDLDEIVLDRIDHMMSLMENRLYSKLSEEIDSQFARLKEKTMAHETH